MSSRHRLLAVGLAGLLLVAPGAGGAVTFLQPLPAPTEPGGARGVRHSPDGKHVYVVGSGVVTVYARDTGTGVLTFVETLAAGGIFGQRNTMAISPDGAHVYVGGPNNVDVFSRNAVTGSLTFVESESDGVGAVAGFDSAATFVSPDGAHVYVLGAGDNAVAAFTRNGATGELTFIEAELDGVGGVDGLDGAAHLTMSADGGHVYVTSFTDDAVAVFGRNAGTGALTFVEAVVHPTVDDPQGLAVSPDGEHLYVASSQGYAIAVFDRNPATGELTFIEAPTDGVGGVDGLLGPTNTAVSADGVHVYVGSYEALAIFSRNATTGALTFVATETDDVLTPVAALDPTADGAYLFAASYDGIAELSRNAGTGLLTFVDQMTALSSGQGLAVSPDGAHVYVAGFFNGVTDGPSRLGVYARDVITGALRYVEAFVDDKFGMDGLGYPFAVLVSPDGAHVYVAGANDDAVTVFARNASTGQLTFVESQVDGIGGVDGLAFVQTMAISPDGAHLYAAGSADDAVAVFARNAGTGALTFVEIEQNGIGGAEGLEGVRYVAVSPDGAHVYAGGDEDAIVTLGRNGVTGALAFQGIVRDDVGGVRGLTGLRGLGVAPGGGTLHAAGVLDGVVTFARDVGTGALSSRDLETSGRRGIPDVTPQGIVVSPDGAAVYVPAGDALAGFAREVPGGTLAYVETQPAGFGTFRTAAAVSPDSRHVYVDASPVEGFAVTPVGCTAAPIAPCRDAGQSSLVVADRPSDRRDVLVWRWQDGDETMLADFGDPTTTNHYALCAYDESGPPALVLAALAPAGGGCNQAADAGPCWTVGADVRYRDRFRTPEGLILMTLVPGGAGQAEISVRARGEDLRTPTLPLGLPLRVQVQSAAGECWEATYSAADINSAERFRAAN